MNKYVIFSRKKFRRKQDKGLFTFSLNLNIFHVLSNHSSQQSKHFAVSEKKTLKLQPRISWGELSQTQEELRLGSL